MADRPILFSAPMVFALLAGRKTMTRRILKPQPPESFHYHCWYHAPIYGFALQERPSGEFFKVRLLGYKGDRLWVRETWGREDFMRDLVYRAGDDSSAPLEGGRWKPSIFMPRWASRLTLIVEDVKVERLQDISEDDAEAEGWPPPEGRAKTGIAEIKDAYPIGWYAWLWNSIHGATAWEENPWVAAYRFRVIKGNIDQIGGAQ